jgi:hypothetical protein
VRTYHYDRDPPASYLARVVEVFPQVCTLEWLITGKGPRFQSETRVREARKELWDAIRGGGAVWLAASPGTESRMLEVFERFHAWNEQHARMYGQHPIPTPKDSVRVFSKLLNDPVLRWRYEKWNDETQAGYIDIHPERSSAYLDAALHAISLAIPDGRDFALRRVESDSSAAASAKSRE